MRVLRPGPALKLLLALLIATPASAQQQFFGRVRTHLEPTQQFAVLHWDLAKSSDLAMLPTRIPSSTAVHIGQLDIGDRDDLKFIAALVEQSGQPPCLYVDLHHRRHFESRDRVCFHSLPASSGYAAGASLSLPLTSGPFRSYPVDLRLPKPASVDPHSNTAPTIEPSMHAMAIAEVHLPNRSLLLGYIFDPATNSANPSLCRQFADLNDDGKLDILNEGDAPKNNIAPVFHIAPYFLRTTELDLRTHRAVLTSVPATEYTRFDLWPGSTLPNFAFTTFSGQQEHLANIHGHLILLDFWATWCAACVADMPSKKATYEKYHARGFEILGIDGEPGTGKAEKLIAKIAIPWPQVKVSGELINDRFHITFWPTEILIDEHGRILDRDLDHLSGDGLAATLDRLLPKS